MRTQNIPFLNTKKKIFLNYPKSASMGFFSKGPKLKRVRNNRGKRAISVQATEVLLYLLGAFSVFDHTKLSWGRQLNLTLFSQNRQNSMLP